MPLKSVISFLRCRMKEEVDYLLYREIVAENIATIANGKVTQNRISYSQERKKIYGEIKQDLRTAKEIVNDTFKRFGLKIKTEGQSELI